MPRPTNKDELLNLGLENYKKLFDLINSFSKEQLNSKFLFEDRDKNIRDVLTHLHEWHLMMMKWYTIGMSGTKPDMPAKGYTWKTTADLNQTIWEKYQNTSYKEALLLLDESFNNIQNLIKEHSNDELFEKKRYKWTGTTSLGSYLVSATSSHYDWAIKKIKKQKKALK
jgi:hypothetical protein